MSVKLNAKVTLRNHTSSAAPHAFMWFEAIRNGTFEERANKLRDADHFSWCADVEVEGDSASGLYFLAGWEASVGAELQVELSDPASGRRLFAETVVLDRPAHTQLFRVLA